MFSCVIVFILVRERIVFHVSQPVVSRAKTVTMDIIANGAVLQIVCLVENQMGIAIPVIVVLIVKLHVRSASHPDVKLVLTDIGEVFVSITVAITVHHITKVTACVYLVRMGTGEVNALRVVLNVKHAINQTDVWSVVLVTMATHVTNTIAMVAQNVNMAMDHFVMQEKNADDVSAQDITDMFETNEDDDARVVVRGGDTDYINASYIDGFRKRKAYIAALGPMAKQLGDFGQFWRMVWQQKVERIAMVTNLVEDEKTKCEQYWPDHGQFSYI
ncbi:PTPRF-like protein [Mya arenaria]|uniref:protein-tyrosine-phosphatase n=1 Tax=Mya arenaria TaxID=6604 RepID=A0ABY7F841_MYAAR|nr:PTPRF-like protein [Mya arenaria]